MKTNVLVGIDPGVTTGVATKISDSYATCVFTDPDSLWDFLKEYKPDIVAFETFIRSNRIDANMLHTIEMVGSIRGICHVLGIPAFGQQPQTRRSFIPDAKKALSQRRNAGITVHEIDALSHLLLLEYRISHNILGVPR